MKTALSFVRQKYLQLLETLESPSDKTIWLAVFRVFLSFHLVKRLFFTWPYLQLLYSKHSFVLWSDRAIVPWVENDWLKDHYISFYAVYLLLVLFMGFGIGRRLTVFGVFVMTVILQRWSGYTLNGGDNLLKFVLLYMSLCDSFQRLALFPSREPRTANWKAINNAFTNLGVLSILIHLSIVYAVSAVAKVHADVWYRGTANYFILSLQRFCGMEYNYRLVNSALFVVATTYVTLFWELTFPFFIWRRHLRWFSIGCGILMHAGIYCMMMIHDFEVLFMMTYGFILFDSELSFIRQKLANLFNFLPLLKSATPAPEGLAQQN